MKIQKIILGLFLFLWAGWGCKPTQNTTTMNGERYETAEGDPLGVKVYTLKNGLKVYMSVVKDAPRIQTLVATRAGSKNDPSDATGLAHYLEHMLFKGTSEIGALDWKSEKKLLKQISKLYEEHRTAAEEERPAIYRKIDSLSSAAAKLVAANEYDKMISSLGAKGTNAFTSLDKTVYINDIPSNELEKWMRIESERFSELVLRLFHTELETVYEEFNISQNRDGRKVFREFMEALCPRHPYGTQTTLGKGEHLKTPSMEKIHEFFDTYYVPNNMAIILSGDFDPDEAVAFAEKYWGKFKTKKIKEESMGAQPPLKEKVTVDVYGPEKERVQLGWRLPGAGTDDALLGKIAANILYNRVAGLIDVNLVQQQKLGQNSAAGCWSANDYSFFYLYGEPRQSQQLKRVVQLLLLELDKLKNGEFEDWMLEAVINNLEYQKMRSHEKLRGRAFTMLDAFIYEQDWKEASRVFERMRAFSKEDVVNFAKQYLKDDNYAGIYKREGIDKNIMQVNKPKITPVSVNRDTMSDYRKAMMQMESPRQQPVFVDYENKIETARLASGIGVDYIKNEANNTFELFYVMDMGSNHDNVLPIAIKCLPLLGTKKYSPEAFKKELFKYGLSFDVYVAQDRSYVTLRGLDRSLEKGIELLEHLLDEAKPDQEKVDKLIKGIIKERQDEKKDKRIILRQAMKNYGIYGARSPFRLRLHPNMMSGIRPKDLMERIQELTDYEHRVFYYGTKSKTAVVQLLEKYHKVSPKRLPIPPPLTYSAQSIDDDRVFFVNFPGMTQAEVLLLSKGTDTFNLEEHVMSYLYNQYFGAGLSSVVFQEIRESRALAYSAYAFNRSPRKDDKAHVFQAFVGTQTDKMQEAVPALRKIIEQMPISDDQINNAVDAVLKKMETERITKASMYWSMLNNKRRGFDRDIRQDVYKRFKALAADEKAAVEAIKKFHQDVIKNRQYTIMVLGDKTKIDTQYLGGLGAYKELTLSSLFGY